MTILYRSPDVQIDAHRWHVVVTRSPRNGRVATVFRFRQTPKEAWRPSTSWPGRLPKGMRDQFFRPFLRSIEIARAGAEKHAF